MIFCSLYSPYNEGLMVKKIDVLNALKDFPEEISIEELIERLLLIEKISLGKKESDTGMIVSEE